jgi:signal-transduction protein with cAMP-binding, CBS, and nucleotidyltransferase domain
LISTEDNNAKSFLSMPVSSILQRNMAILDRFQTAADAITAMRDLSVRSVLVADTKKEIIGLVSKTDILYRLLSVPPEVTIFDALAAMEKHNIRQLVVSSDSKVYGTISREDIIIKTEKAVVQTVNSFKLDSAVCIMSPFASTSLMNKRDGLTCPHCSNQYNNKELLSKHVKVIHSDSK